MSENGMSEKMVQEIAAWQGTMTRELLTQQQQRVLTILRLTRQLTLCAEYISQVTETDPDRETQRRRVLLETNEAITSMRNDLQLPMEAVLWAQR